MVNGWIMSGDIVAASIRDNIVLLLLPEHCPLCFQCGGDIVSWLKSRAIDRKRPNARILKRILRLGDTSDLNTALHVHAQRSRTIIGSRQRLKPGLPGQMSASARIILLTSRSAAGSAASQRITRPKSCARQRQS